MFSTLYHSLVYKRKVFTIKDSFMSVGKQINGKMIIPGADCSVSLSVAKKSDDQSNYQITYQKLLLPVLMLLVKYIL